MLLAGASVALLGMGSLAGQVAAVPSWGIGPFSRPAGAEPVIRSLLGSSFLCPMRKKNVNWESYVTYNPAAIVRHGQIVVLYRAQDNLAGNTSRLGLATSTDGLTFKRSPTPVLYPDNDSQRAYEWYGGCEDPRVCQTAEGTYVLTYTEYNLRNTLGNKVLARLAVATSTDLVNWTKYGPAFAHTLGGKYLDSKSKSGCIVQQLVQGQPVAVKINGKYWMYWGEGAVDLAWSTDLVNWTPVEDAKGHLLPLLAPRSGKFDGGLAEGGPMALLTKDGIVVIYNGKNGTSGGDPTLGPGAYSTGQALFSATDPANLLSRTDTPFIKPELPWETGGQYAAGTTFSEGMAYFKGNWYLYYGASDSFVGVATTGPVLTCPTTRPANLALNQPVTVSSVSDPVRTPGSNAVDGATHTRWSSRNGDHEWIYVDLGDVTPLTGVTLDWESAYASSYKIQVSNDSSAWTDVYSTTKGTGGIENIGFTAKARYVRMLGLKRATEWGYSLWEFEVHGPQ